MPKNDKHLIHFLFELGMLKKIEHCGTKFAGVKHPDTLGEHSCRAAQIGYALAIAEKANPEKVAIMCLMHDIGEIRIGDAHRIAQRYLKTFPAEKRAMEEQTEKLPMPLQNRIRTLWNEFHDLKTPEALVARDADLLETILQAKEYLDLGAKAAKRWLDNGSKYLKTQTAKKLFRLIEKTQFTDWWDHLNKA
ncbi:HD domain-containing protein [Candidatus Peregrinibacteria bacterium]|nr:HD domain-containing protein [Candidatus Peregrinibacteria bacterium]